MTELESLTTGRGSLERDCSSQCSDKCSIYYIYIYIYIIHTVQEKNTGPLKWHSQNYLKVPSCKMPGNQDDRAQPDTLVGTFSLCSSSWPCSS